MHLDKKIPYTSKEKELLLQAALLDKEHSINAWQQWKKTVDLEGHHDNGSYSLFPLLYKNLQRYGVNDPFMKRLKGIFRLEWYKNQRLFYDMSKIIQYLNDTGIQVMTLNCLALITLYYKNFAVRPLADLGILVPTSQALLTIGTLKKAGWIQSTNLKDDFLCYQHSVQFKDQSGKELDLHWHLLFESCQEDSDRDFWDGAVPIRVNEVSTYALNPTDNLFYVVVQGVRLNTEPPIRWIADAMSIINSTDSEIDWPRLIKQAKKSRLIIPIKEALNYLHEKFQAPIPNSIVENMNQLSISCTESLEYRIMTRRSETS
ncbi:MAG: nucleotidyltransferase family protein, partial [Planctomycetota bacterium]